MAVLTLLAGPWNPGPGAQAPPDPRRVTLILDWEGAQPQHLPFWLARERGWYAAEGLEVRIQPGRGSGQVAQVVAAGQAEFGQMSPVVLVQAVARQQAPLRMVGVTLQRDTISLKYFLTSPIRSPRDLEGRTLGLIPGSVAELLWPAFARAASIDASRVRVVGVDFRTYGQLFAAGQTDATNSVVGHHENVALARHGRPVGDLLYADHLPMIGLGVVTSTRTLTEREDVVRAFMRGTRKGWDHLLQSPREAVTEAARIVRREVAGAPDEDVLVEACLQVIPQFMRPNPLEGKPPGWSSPEAWKRLVAVLQEHDQLPRSPGVDELMTNRFVE